MKQQCEELRYREVSALLASDAEAHDYFGISATVDGNRLVVGAGGKDIAAPNAGKVYIYEWNPTTSAYIEVAQLTASAAAAYDYFGVSVALSGNRLVVGAYGKDTAGVAAGKVYIYEWDPTTSAYIEVAQLTASDATAYDYFGVSVAISGNRLVVGAYVEDTAVPNAGKVYVYDWNGNAYVEVAQLTASEAAAYEWFGSSVALSGDRLVVGAYTEDTVGLNVGKVYAYDWDGSAYVEVVQLTASAAEAYDKFGSSVALSGNRLVVGACGVYTTGVDAGKVYVYDWNGVTSVYDEVTTITDYAAQAGDWFGRSVTVDGDRLIVGAGGKDTVVPNVGKVYIYDWDTAE